MHRSLSSSSSLSLSQLPPSMEEVKTTVKIPLNSLVVEGIKEQLSILPRIHLQSINKQFTAAVNKRRMKKLTISCEQGEWPRKVWKKEEEEEKEEDEEEEKEEEEEDEEQKEDDLKEKELEERGKEDVKLTITDWSASSKARSIVIKLSTVKSVLAQLLRLFPNCRQIMIVEGRHYRIAAIMDGIYDGLSAAASSTSSASSIQPNSVAVRRLHLSELGICTAKAVEGICRVLRLCAPQLRRLALFDDFIHRAGGVALLVPLFSTIGECKQLRRLMLMGESASFGDEELFRSTVGDVLLSLPHLDAISIDYDERTPKRHSLNIDDIWLLLFSSAPFHQLLQRMDMFKLAWHMDEDWPLPVALVTQVVSTLRCAPPPAFRRVTLKFDTFGEWKTDFDSQWTTAFDAFLPLIPVSNTAATPGLKLLIIVNQPNNTPSFGPNIEEFSARFAAPPAHLPYAGQKEEDKEEGRADGTSERKRLQRSSIRGHGGCIALAFRKTTST